MARQSDEYDEHMMALDDSMFRARVIDQMAEMDAKLLAIERELTIVLQILQLISSTLIKNGYVDERFVKILEDIDAIVDATSRGTEKGNHGDQRYRPPRTRG